MYYRKAISSEMPGRYPKVLSVRYKSLQRNNGTYRDMYYAREYWTEEQDSLLRNLLAQGLFITEVAQRLRKNYQSVHSRARKTNLHVTRKFKPYTPGDDETISGMRRDGKTWKEIAMKLGPNRTPESVSEHYYRYMQKCNDSPSSEQKTIGSPARPMLHSPSADLASIGGKR